MGLRLACPPTLAVLTQNLPQNKEGQLRPVWGPRLANRVVAVCEFLSHSPNKVTPACMQGPPCREPSPPTC